MRTVLALSGLAGLFEPLAGKSHRLLGCLLMVAGALIALLAWASGPRLELRS
jgi:hypothetical protein